MPIWERRRKFAPLVTMFLALSFLLLPVPSGRGQGDCSGTVNGSVCGDAGGGCEACSETDTLTCGGEVCDYLIITISCPNSLQTQTFVSCQPEYQ
jgi:hypothetical protein